MLGLKRSYTNDCKENLRSGSGQVNKKYWHECHELWGGSAGTEPLDFGMETLSTETAQSEAETETGSVDKEETTEISGNTQDDSDDGDLRSVSPAPSVSSNLSCSEGGAKSSRKRAQKSTKTFVDNKREKLQKKLTQEGKQDILLQHSQRQLELQQAMMEGVTRKDDGLEAAMRSMAESSALLNKTLATGLQFMFSAMQRPGNIGYQSSNPPGFTANNWVNQSQFPPFYPNTHMSATREHTEQHNFDFDGCTHGGYNE